MSRALDEDDIEGEAALAVVAPAPETATDDAGARKSPPESKDPLEGLVERCPSTKMVIDSVRSSRDITLWFTHSETFPEEKDRDPFFAEELWYPVRDLLIKAIFKYIPKHEKEVKRKAARFEAKKRRIIGKHIGSFRLFEDGSASGESRQRYEDMVTYLGQIGMKFVAEFQRLVTPPGGEERVSLKEQLEIIVAAFVKMPTKSWFDSSVGQHVYYIVGFFCDAGAKEAVRRTKDNDVGECIKAINRHYALGREEEAVRRIRAQLESEGVAGLTALVDQRCNYGGLKYPDLALFSVFSMMETAYSRLANSTNFTVFGGTLLTQICAEMLSNETIVSVFSDLFEPGRFSAETIAITMEYYVKVYGNVRAKDLCYRYNSNIMKGATVGLRQKLAAGGTKGKKEASEPEVGEDSDGNKRQKNCR